MELFSLHSPATATRLLSFPWRRALMGKTTPFPAEVLTFSSKRRKYPGGRNAHFIDLRAQAAGSTKGVIASNLSTTEATGPAMSSKDKDLAFVAGASGRVGSRTVRELLRLGFRVRAGVRSSQRAEAVVESVRKMKLDNATGASGTQRKLKKHEAKIPAVEKLEIVECDLENKGSIGPAIGNASVVICCIGASEKEVFDVTGPYRIDYKATENLIEAATIAKVDHFILLTSLGTNKIGFPASILNLFWGVLIWKRKAEEALIASGLPYTIVRPGGMERPTDSYKETHNIVLANEDTFFGGQVSNLQVAELMAFMAKSTRLSYYKVVEVIAETTAPLLPMDELLAKIPSQRELPAEVKSEPAPLSIDSTPIKSVVEEEPGQMAVPKTKSLSPYIMYDDLKPPTSPTPTPSIKPETAKVKHVGSSQPEIDAEPTSSDNISSRLIENVTDTESTATSGKTWSLSPYTAYEDLKPPTSPSPTPTSASNNTMDILGNAKLLVESNTGNGTAGANSDDVSGKDISSVWSQNSSHYSPFPVYDDFKPPTSPSPNAPMTATAVSITATDGNIVASISSTSHTLAAGELEFEQHVRKQEQQALSPFTMYDDLKPPTSPRPSLPKY